MFCLYKKIENFKFLASEWNVQILYKYEYTSKLYTLNEWKWLCECAMFEIVDKIKI